MKYLFKLWWLLVLITVILVLVSRLLSLNYGPISFGLWLISIGALLQLTKPNRHRKEQKRRSKTQRKKFDFFLLTAVIIAVLPVMLALRQPNTLFFHGDEAVISRNAESAVKQAITTGSWNLLGHEDGTITRFPAAWYVAQGLLISALGPSTTSIRVLSVIFQLIIVAVQYRLIKKYFSTAVALGWTMIYVTAPIVLHFSLTAYQNFGSSLFTVLTVASLLESETNKTQSQQRYGLIRTGILAGLGLYTYLSSLFIPAYVVCILFLYGVAYRKKLYRVIVDGFTFFGGFLVAALPYLLVSLNDYNLILGRKSAIGPLLENLKRGQLFEFLNFLIAQTVVTFKPIVVGGFTGGGQHYIHQPIFVHVSLAVFAITSLVWLIADRRLITKQQKLFVLSTMAVIVITLLLGSILTEDPPAVQRVVAIFPYLFFVVTIGIWITLKKGLGWIEGGAKLLRRNIQIQSYFVVVLFFIIIGALSARQLYQFFTVNLRLNRDEHMTNQFVQDFAAYYQALQTDQPGESVLYAFIPSHYFDQLYFYSEGTIDAVKIKKNREQFITPLKGINKIYLLTRVDPQLIESHDTYDQVWQEDDYYLYLVK